MMDRHVVEVEWRDRYRTVSLKIEGKDKGPSCSILLQRGEKLLPAATIRHGDLDICDL
jgi:hypothetical protein